MFTGWPKKWEHEYDCQLNDLGLHVYTVLVYTTDDVVVWNSSLQIMTDTLNMLLKTFDNFADIFYGADKQ